MLSRTLSLVSIESITPSTISTTVGIPLDRLDSLVIQLVLQGKSTFVAVLEMLLPSVIDTAREHELDLRDLGQVVLLVFDDAHNVLFTTLTEAILNGFLAWLLFCFLFLP